MAPTSEEAPLQAGSLVAHGTLLKLGAEVAALVLSFATGVITARNLGPGGKGDLATMGFVMVFGASAAGLGLGEAGVTATIRGSSLRSVVRATTSVILLSAALAMVVFAVFARLLFAESWSHVAGAVAFTTASLVPAAAMLLGAILLDAPREFGVTALSRVLAALVTAVGTYVAISTGRGISGAAAAGLVGWVVGAFIVLRKLRRLGVLGWPSLDRTYLRSALRLGLPIQLSQLLMIASTRLDVVVVYLLVGSQDAGRYSVAITMGSLNTFVPLSLAAAAYPRVAALRAEELAPYVARLCRASLVAAVGIGAVIAAVLPVLIPRAFGAGFRDSAGPAALLLVGGALWSAQWILCRAWAAAGDGRLLLVSYAASLTSMIALDLVLIPIGGTMGAAIASVSAAAIGTAVALSRFRSYGPLNFLVPRRHDLQEIARSLQAATRTRADAAPLRDPIQRP